MPSTPARALLALAAAAAIVLGAAGAATADTPTHVAACLVAGCPSVQMDRRPELGDVGQDGHADGLRWRRSWARACSWRSGVQP